MTEATATQAEKRRRRWMTFGEIATVLALTISAASFWDSHKERTEARANAEKAKATKPASAPPLVLKATADDEGDTLALAPTGDLRVIQTQTILFPAAIDASSVDTVGNPHIESGWFAAGLRTALGDVRKPGRVPVGIVTHYTDNGTERTDFALYDIGHGWRSRLLQRDVPKLEGITLITRLRGADTLQKSLDTRWARSHPAA